MSCSHLIQKISQYLFYTCARCAQSHRSSHSAGQLVRLFLDYYYYEPSWTAQQL
jgi:hypothetical protein